MKKILITGATGNVGEQVIKFLVLKQGNFEILAGVRDLGDGHRFPNFPDVKPVRFDFGKKALVDEALAKVDILFLLRPPQLINIKSYFEPLIQSAVKYKVRHIVFLSVQGAEKNSFIPHHKIEKLILDSKLNYTFLRPAYFMQNFTTTLKTDLIEHNRIYLPAGGAVFTLIDLEDVGKVAAEVLSHTQGHQNKAYTLTANQKLNFKQMADSLSRHLNRSITYKSPNPLVFLWKMKQRGHSVKFILVLIMLHYLPRFKSAPNISKSVKTITGFEPNSFSTFIQKNKKLLSYNQ